MSIKLANGRGNHKLLEVSDSENQVVFQTNLERKEISVHTAHFFIEMNRQEVKKLIAFLEQVTK